MTIFRFLNNFIKLMHSLYFMKLLIGYFLTKSLYMHNDVHNLIWYGKIMKLFWSVCVFVAPKNLPIIGFDGSHENERHSLYTFAEEKTVFLSNFMHNLVLSIRWNRKISNGMNYWKVYIKQEQVYALDYALRRMVAHDR